MTWMIRGGNASDVCEVLRDLVTMQSFPCAVPHRDRPRSIWTVVVCKWGGSNFLPSYARIADVACSLMCMTHIERRIKPLVMPASFVMPVVRHETTRILQLAAEMRP